MPVAAKRRYPPEIQAAVDEEHLRLLAVAHYIEGGLVAVNASFFLLYVGMGAAMIINPAWFVTENGSDPVFAGWMLFGFGMFLTLLGWTFAGLTAYSGRCISQQRRRTFSLIMGLLNCLCVPLGTVLGVFTFITLGRPSVRELYAGASPLLFDPTTNRLALNDINDIDDFDSGKSSKPVTREITASGSEAKLTAENAKKIEFDLKKLEDEEEAIWQEMERKAKADAAGSQNQSTDN